MSQLIHSGQKTTMSSREIADMTGSTHDNVLKTIRALVGRGVVSANETPYTHPQNGQTYREFLLGYRDTMVVVSGYSVELRARIIDRWQELEAAASAPQFSIPTTLSGALRLAAEQAEQIERQQQVIEQQKPAVEFVEKYVNSTGEKGFREVCKILNVNEARFREFLLDKRIMYRLGGRMMAYQNHIDAGRFRITTGVNQGNEHSFTSVKMTPKGVEWVAGEWAKHQVSQSTRH